MTIGNPSLIYEFFVRRRLAAEYGEGRNIDFSSQSIDLSVHISCKTSTPRTPFKSNEIFMQQKKTDVTHFA